jgi:hypothetical protein
MKRMKKIERAGEVEIAVELLGWRWYNPPGYCSVLLPPDSPTFQKEQAGKWMDTKPAREPKYCLGIESVPQFYSDFDESMPLQEIVRERKRSREYLNELAFLKTQKHPADLNQDDVIDLLMSATPRERSLAAFMALKDSDSEAVDATPPQRNK